MRLKQIRLAASRFFVNRSAGKPAGVIRKLANQIRIVNVLKRSLIR